MIETLETSISSFTAARCDYAVLNCAEYMNACLEFERLHKQARAAAGDNSELKKLLSNLETAAGVTQLMADAAYKQGFNKFNGKTFVLTGELRSMSRHVVRAKIEELGGSVQKMVDKNTDYLLAGDYPGSRVLRAQVLNIPVIDEATFLNMVAPTGTDS